MDLSAPDFLAVCNYAGDPRAAARDDIMFAAQGGGGRGGEGDENSLLRCDVMNGTVDYETQSFPQCLPTSVVVVGGRDLGEDGVLVVDLPRPLSYMVCVCLARWVKFAVRPGLLLVLSIQLVSLCALSLPTYYLAVRKN